MATLGIVVFVPSDFRTAFPAFATLSDAALNGNFAFATSFLDNSLSSPVQDVNIRAQLLNLLVAHISALLNGVNGQPSNGAVGRIAEASEGSVSARLEYSSSVSQSQAFFIQTQWGAMYWQMTSACRAMRYVTPCSPPGVSRGYGSGWPYGRTS